MSLSEIIQKKYKKKQKINKLTQPEEAAAILIKDVSVFDVNRMEYTEGTKEEQKEMQLGDIETDGAKGWSDLNVIKQKLWEKLHQSGQLSTELNTKINSSLSEMKPLPKKKIE